MKCQEKNKLHDTNIAKYRWKYCDYRHVFRFYLVIWITFREKFFPKTVFSYVFCFRCDADHKENGNKKHST